jgi:hypothetical protein
MYFLIDYENVKNAGMQGSDYLLPEDHVILFYSSSVPTMEHRHLMNIQNSGCGFETYKLLAQRKNGLDFYIATKLGELFGAGRCKNAVLVSNDSGFKAIREFWQQCSGTKNRVAISDSIEYGIIAANEASERANLIRSYRKTVDIGNFYAAYRQEQKLRKILQDAFAETAFSDRVNDIETILKAGKAPKVVYLDSLRKFGRKDGQEIYRILKNCAGFNTPPSK